ncbi:MAG: biotin--[acetyl-CoA-carboxylase] ligase [Acidobacteriota bacterium]
MDLDPLRLRDLLMRRTGPSGAVVVGRRVEYYARLSSTNDRARELASSGEPEGTVVLAGEQTHGRGRASHSWHSPPGLGVYLSAIFRPVALPSAVPLFGLLAAVAATYAMHRLDLDTIRIKWPNDLVIPDRSPAGRYRKVGGILTEARTGPDTIRDLVVGVGVNVNHTESDFPAELEQRPTSLRIIGGRVIDRTDVAFQVLAALGEWYAVWPREGDEAVLQAYVKLALDLRGARVRVRGDDDTWEGVTAGLSPDGALRVVPDGPRPAARDGVVEVRYGDLAHIEET